ncbi:MAG: hypothetical protein WC323_03355 [Patescibacteria group bacterium]|jgi:uncharacterized protein YjeT (DUF2065 family)
MNNIIKWGIIFAVIYVIITPVGFFLEKTTLENVGLLMAGTLWIFSIPFGSPYVDFHAFSFPAFILGGLFWFLAGAFFRWVSGAKNNSKRKMNFIGRILMIIGAVIFILFLAISLVWAVINCAGPYQEGNVLFCTYISTAFAAVIYFPPFILGLILWVISKFIPEKNY